VAEVELFVFLLFAVVILAGLGLRSGVPYPVVLVVGGLVIGLVKALGGQYIGAEWSEALIFGILIVILIFRPNGLLGQQGTAAIGMND